MSKIAVIGGGINGLSCAVCLQEKLPNAEVTIISEKWLTETTSTGAAGLFRPYNVIAEHQEDAQKWIETSAKHFWSISASKNAAAAGVFEIGGYIVSNDEIQLVEAKQYRDSVHNYQRLEGRELDKFGESWRYGCYLSTLVIEPAIHMKYLTNKFEASGGKKVTQRINSLADLHGQYAVVVNCSGLGALTLSRDQVMKPVRGQLARVRAPWLKTFYMAENHTYIYPNAESVVLGGTRQLDDWGIEVRPEDSKNIMQKCSKIVPALEDSPVISEWVGLRPFRISTRLETENFALDGDREIIVIHNYGHGGNGISLSWGCAVDVVEKVIESLVATS